MEHQLIDRHGRVLNYVRIAITDRCNLRCSYCMPECGIDFVERSELLSYEEIERLMSILAGCGVSKVRITGGEPFVRKNSMEFMERLSNIQGVEHLHLTTNATLCLPYIDRLKSLPLKSVNISLDTLNEARFLAITKREGLSEVLASMHAFIEAGIPTKINMVVMNGINHDDLLSMAELAKDLPIQMRFIEEMPFNGADHVHKMTWNHIRILERIREKYPEIQPISFKSGETAQRYQVPGWKGSLGIIAAFSRTFCGTCNRLRITPNGTLKTCLYDDGVLDLRALLRSDSSDREILQAVIDAVANKPKNGWEAEQMRKVGNIAESMATIGG